ncbi:transposase [Streptomyces noursei]|uniref:transposase n=1 Tax=Streptomyces noursei TaxID=1971 RepID=UPI0037984D88
MRKKYDAEFRAGAVRIVRETGKPVAQVARDLGKRGHAGHVDLPGQGDHPRWPGSGRAGRACSAAPGDSRAAEGT